MLRDLIIEHVEDIRAGRKMTRKFKYIVCDDVMKFVHIYSPESSVARYSDPYTYWDIKDYGKK